MKQTKIILVTGKAQAGKSTSCDFLENHIKYLGYSCKTFNFADPLKEFCINVLGLDELGVYGPNENKNKSSHIMWRDLPIDKEISASRLLEKDPDDMSPYLTNREVLQIFGTEICRKMYPDCWVLATLNQIYDENPDYALIADVRFPNEIQSMKLGGEFELFQERIDPNPYILRLTRNPLNLTHISETALDDFDFKGYDMTTILNQDMDVEVRNIDLKLAFKQILKLQKRDAINAQ